MPSAREIKKQQEEALASLPVNTLFIILKNRDDPPQKDDFHWGYYFHTHAAGGIKYHATNIVDNWIGDHGPTGGVMKSLFLCAMVQIADIPPQAHAKLDEIMRSYDSSLNDYIISLPGPTCRTWLMEVMKRLVDAGLVQCKGTVDELQEECLEIGNRFSAETSENKQPRPVIKSKLCY